VYGKDVIPLEYRRPGFKISRDVADTIREHPEAKALVLAKHGTICWGATVKEAYEATIELITRAEERSARAAADAGVRATTRARAAGHGAPRDGAHPGAEAPRPAQPQQARDRELRRLGARPGVRLLDGGSRAVPGRPGHAGPHDLHEASRRVCLGPTGNPATLGRRRRCRRRRFVEDYTRYFEANRFEGAELVDPLPRVVLVPRLGMFTAGKDRRTAGIVNDIYHHTIDVIATPRRSGATRRSPRRRVSTSSTGRSSSTSSRWRRPRRSWPGVSSS